jgi:2-hydroxy-6-oxonona-2,4-dienedioate hydrolase
VSGVGAPLPAEVEVHAAPAAYAARPLTGRLESRWTRVNGHEIHYRASTGPAPAAHVPVVLVHGQVVASRYMLPVAEHLAPHFRVFVPDLPGFGRSHKPREVLDVEGLAHALAAWMRAVGLGRAHFVGNSLGCNTIVELAVAHPELVERLVLQGPVAEPRARTAPRLLTKWAQNVRREAPMRRSSGMTRIMLRDYRAAGTRRAVGTLRNLLRHPIERRLPLVVAPALVLRGTRDPLVSPAWARRVAELLPHGRLIEIPGGAHTLNMFAPLEMARVLRPFLAGDAAVDGTPQGLSAP